MATEFGYTGKMLRVDLSSGSTSDIATKEYADRFLGGRGIAAKLYWDEVSPDTKALDPENRLLFVTGPLTGVAGLASSRVEVCGKSPATTPEHFCYASLGGSWGVYLKFAGYDGIVVQGKSDKPVYLFIHDGICEIRNASYLWGKGAFRVREELKSELGSATGVIATGTAGDNMVVFASLLADNDAVAAGGLGAVMGSKRLKAIAVSGNRKVTVANPEKLGELTRYILELKRGPTEQPREAPANPKMEREICWDCIGCNRVIYKADNGQQGKFICQASLFYRSLARKYYGESNDVPFQATKLCDDYGLDTKAIAPMITWLSRCEQAGILTEKDTGLPISQLGSLEFIEALVQKISLREGFGDILAQGTLRAANMIGGRAAEQMADFPFKAENEATYCPRMYITTGLLYMVEPRPPVPELHEIGRLVINWTGWVKNEEGAYLSSDVIRAIARKFLGSELALDFSTYEGKPLAAKVIQDREYAKECLILCDSLWPIMHSEYSEDHVGDPTLESKLVSVVTGNELDENELYRLGERVFNLQRAILIREGHQGREDDALPEPFYTVPLETDSRNPECLAPGKGGQVITRKGTVIDRGEFEKLKDEYYALRGWDVASGRQTRTTLSKLGLEDIARDLEQRGLIAEG
ncbi:aldehyde ferredoxin oxidoreductase N-terminal domain-containing protein [Chloroflexota bacterium]